MACAIRAAKHGEVADAEKACAIDVDDCVDCSLMVFLLSDNGFNFADSLFGSTKNKAGYEVLRTVMVEMIAMVPAAPRHLNRTDLLDLARQHLRKHVLK